MWLKIAVVTLALFCVAATDRPQTRQVYTVAVLPSAPPVTLHRQWAPLLERLTRDTGAEFRLRVFERMEEFEREISAGRADFIFASPIQTVVAHRLHRYIPLVRDAKPVFASVFVRRDSPYKTLGDLEGQTISFVGAKNTCSVIVRHFLGTETPRLTFASHYSGSSSNVIKAVMVGKAAAGVVFSPEMERQTPETREMLVPAFQTPALSSHPLSAHPRIPRAVQSRVKAALVGLAATKEGRELLTAVRLGDPVTADYDRDYRNLEIIDVQNLTDWGR